MSSKATSRAASAVADKQRKIRRQLARHDPLEARSSSSRGAIRVGAVAPGPVWHSSIRRFAARQGEEFG
ncbi:MAG TPA: hypothetical protein VFF72_00310, partial [Caldimonas sp.]|nr:hypothetical protein [Caldimonas sp.]